MMCKHAYFGTRSDVEGEESEAEMKEGRESKVEAQNGTRDPEEAIQPVEVMR